MEALGLFNLLEEYIAKAEYKIDEVDKIIEDVLKPLKENAERAY